MINGEAFSFYKRAVFSKQIEPYFLVVNLMFVSSSTVLSSAKMCRELRRCGSRIEGCQDDDWKTVNNLVACLFNSFP